MLGRIQEQLGLEGFSRVLLDSFEPEEFEQLVEECGLESRPSESAERKALGLANLISSWPQLAAEITRLLHSANREVTERLQGLSDEALLCQFSPQNAELDVAPGRLLWALLCCGSRPACRELLRIWVDFLDRPDAGASESSEAHFINEQNVLEAERRAVALFAGEEEPSPPEQAEEADLEHAEEARPEQRGETAEAEVAPLSPSTDPERNAAEEIKALLDDVVAVQRILERQLESLEGRLDRLETLSQALQQEIETVKSEEQQLLSAQAEQAASLLAEVQEQTHLIRSGLQRIPSALSAEAQEATSGPEEEEPSGEPAAPEREEREAARPGKDFAQPEGTGEASAVAAVEEQPGREAEVVGAVEGEAQAPREPDRFSSEPVEELPPLEAVFQNETIVLVGGYDSQSAQYQALIEGLGGRFERYSSVDEFSARWLEDLVDRAYLIVVLGNVATQRGAMSLMEAATRLGRRFFVHHSTAPASLHRFLLQLIERETI